MTPRRFAVRCEPKLMCHFIVEIHPTKAKMMAAMRHFEKQYKPRAKFFHCEASCYSYRLERFGKLTPELGRLFFYERNLHPAVLAHEFTHAAITFCRRRRINPMKSSKVLNDAEERLATCVGWMMLQFYQNQPGRTFFVKISSS